MERTPHHTPMRTSTHGSFAPVIELTKHHGLGNDFLIALEPPVAISDARVVELCQRRKGIGADGVIVAERIDGDDRRWRMVLRNADASRAEISGNGLRCLGQAIAIALDLPTEAAQEILIETDAGPRPLTLAALPAGADPTLRQVQVSMGAITPGPELSERWLAAGVTIKEQVSADVGNPHLVGFVERIDELDIGTIGPLIEASYPQGCNVHLVEMNSPTALSLKVWERGAGITEACGSGACAAAWAAHRLGLADEKVTVSMPGGSVQVELAESDTLLTGPTTVVASLRVRASATGETV